MSEQITATKDTGAKRLSPQFWLATALVLCYVVVGMLYAVETPTWQVPDEPAHYNYVRGLAEERRLPVMESGDYDQSYLQRLTSEKFPSELSIVTLEYEDHQPPLYYLIATPIYWISGGSVVALRSFSVLLGGVGVVMVLLILREFYPQRPWLALLGAGVVAFIPQYVAITAGVNNDALLLPLFWFWLWLALRYLRGETPAWLLGLLMGALLLTKTTGYGALPLALLAILLRYRREGQPLQWAFREALKIFLPALALGGIWWLRNVMVYGWPDILGLMRHNAVVEGQPRTADWIAREGFFPFITGALRTTFRSFWGQFGWMGVVLDTRIYNALAILTGLIFWGGGWRLVEALRQGLEPRQRAGLILLSTAATLTLAMFAGYNLTFVQHQGRYIFPALPVFALAAALGLDRLREKKLAVGTVLFIFAALVLMGIAGLILGDLPLWSMALVGAAMVLLPAAAFLPARWQPLVGALIVVALLALDVWCLYGFIVPMLS